MNVPGMAHMTDVEEAAASRQMLSPGFSARALRNQERVVQLYADQFVATLGRLSVETNKTVNLGDAFNWVTFDVLGQFVPAADCENNC